MTKWDVTFEDGTVLLILAESAVKAGWAAPARYATAKKVGKAPRVTKIESAGTTRTRKKLYQ